MSATTNPAIAIHVFVYGGDAYILPETIMCARQALPEARLVVIDEAEKPCPEELRREVEAAGIEWRVSTWPRGGNLRGKECVAGILSEMLASARSEQDLLIKLDADTCLMNGDELRECLANPEKVMCAIGAMNDRIHGCCYAIKAHAVKNALQYVQTLDMPSHAPEDIMVGLSIYNLYPDPAAHNIHSPVTAGTTWKAFNWWDYPDPRKYKNATVVTTGNMPPAPMTAKQRPLMMRYLRLEAAQYLREQAARNAG